MSVELRLLGALEVWSDGVKVHLGGANQRKALAALALQLGRSVPTERLVEVLWDAPPATAAQQVHKHIHALRQLLGDAITTDNPGYRLVLPPESLDVWRFLDGVERARRLRQDGNDAEAASALGDALALWRGDALAGLDGALRAAAEQLAEERLAAQEEWFDLEISLGRHADVVTVLSELVRRNPLRERLIGHLMLALYRCGRQADALDAFQRLRLRLSSELGMEPSDQLRELHTAVLRRDPSLNADTQEKWTAPTPACLPSDLPSFVGRTEQLEVLSATAATEIRVASITGAAGVGKTALAVRWAHRARQQFPDGQLYVDLRGHDPAPALTAADALSTFLRALGTPPEQVPDSLDARTGLYRSTVDGKRVLVVLDNAASVDQVDPLLPGGRECFVVVTSRNALTGLTVRHDARRIGLDVLPDPDAMALLRRVLGEERVEPEPGAAERLLKLCGNLPLAVRLVAANLANSPHLTIEDMVHELATGDRLDRFDVDGERGAGVRAALDLSFNAVSAAAQRMFALLGAAPLADFDLTAAAALAGIPHREAGQVLAALESAHLVQPGVPGRFRMHDLVKLYASELAADGVEEAAGRLLRHFIAHTDAAITALAPSMTRESRPDDVPPAGKIDPVPWLLAEQHNLVAAVEWAAEQGQRLLGAHLVDALRGAFVLHRLTDVWISTGELGLAMAEELGDARLMSAMHRTLGLAHFYLVDREESVRHNLASLELCEQLGDSDGAVAMLANIALVHSDTGRLAVAAGYLERAITICVRENLTQKEAVCRLGIAGVRSYSGDLREGAEEAERALALAEDIDNPFLKAQAFVVCAWIHRHLGHLARAESYHAQGRQLHREIDHHGGEHESLVWQAGLRRMVGDLDNAAELIDKARELVDKRADHMSEINTMIEYARVQHARQNLEAAAEAGHQAVRRTLDIDGTWPRLEALTALAEIQLSHGDHDAAATNATAVIDLAAETGLWLYAGDAHLIMARAVPSLASVHLEEALALYRRTGQQLREAETLLLMGQTGAAAAMCDDAAGVWGTDVFALMSRSL